jgi:outer membrane protein OmpA-like peptidoglycan-associated protein
VVTAASAFLCYDGPLAQLGGGAMQRKWMGVILALGFLGLAGAAGAAVKIKEHPVIKPIPTAVATSSDFKKYAAHTFRVRKNGDSEKKEVRGKYWEFSYKTAKDISGLEILENYKQEALEKGGKILYEDKSQLVFTLTTPEGKTLWTQVYRDNWNAYYQLYVVEAKEFKKTLTFGAEEMKQQLDEKGSVAVYGILFDFDKATLKPGAEKVLLEMVKLMKSSPDLKVEIQGHTDNVGGKDYNLKLSQERADAVKKFLVLYGIEAGRLTTQGFGLDQPVATNDTEEGRALNRRVELKKL